MWRTRNDCYLQSFHTSFAEQFLFVLSPLVREPLPAQASKKCLEPSLTTSYRRRRRRRRRRRVVVSAIRPSQTFGCIRLLCVPLTFASCSGHFVVHPPQYFWMQGRGRAQNSCCNNAAAVAVVTSCVCFLTVS